MQGEPHGGSIHMANAQGQFTLLHTGYNLSRQSLGQENKGISRRANPDLNGQSGGERQPGHEGYRSF